ncbi:MAG: hypothetical protein HC799_17095 [Limnothrix sp. RL_2_0]|nr:hypothetical protein [Limnothrix sp. RL_2_0]
MSSDVRQPIIIPASNRAPFQRLGRFIRLSQGEFSVVLVNVPTIQTRLAVLKKLRRAIAPTEIVELCLHPMVTDIYAAVESHCRHDNHQYSKILSVSGLGNLEYLDEALLRANFARDRFQKHCPLTMIWWIDDEVSKQIRRYAPDLSSCLAAPIQFMAKDSKRNQTVQSASNLHLQYR